VEQLSHIANYLWTKNKGSATSWTLNSAENFIFTL